MTQNDTTLIGKGIRIEGEITGSASIEVWGTLDGTAGTEGTFKVCEGGKVDGKVAAKEIVVDGEVKGNLVAEQRVALNHKSQVEGEIDIKSTKLAIAEGASFQGSVKMPKG